MDEELVKGFLQVLHNKKILSLSRAKNMAQERYELHPLVRTFCRTVATSTQMTTKDSCG